MADFERRQCPICDWKHDEPLPRIPADALAGVFGVGTMAAVADFQRAHKIERALEAHFATHDTLDWVKGSASLAARLAAAEAALEAAEKDAARYRWLRDTPLVSAMRTGKMRREWDWAVSVAGAWFDNQSLDAAIDAARSTSGETGKPSQASEADTQERSK